MPTPNIYKHRLLSKGNYAGESHKNQADSILENTWYEDLATRTCYLFDYYHDNEPLKLNDLTPDESMMIPIDLKYIVNSSQTLDKDLNWFLKNSLNCWDTLRALIPKQKNEICLYGNGLKSLRIGQSAAKT